MKDVFERLLEIVSDRNTTLYQVAKETDISYSSLRAWNRSIPNVNMAIRVADVLDVPVEYLAMGRKPKTVLSNEEANLLQTYRDLSPEDKETLLEMAEVFKKKNKPKASETSENLNEKLSSLTVN